MSSSAPQAGGSTPKASPSSRTLDDTMREPSTSVPAVVVLDSLHPDEKPKVSMDPKKDLWLSTVDGRHQSPIIPVRCGPEAETFYVHRDILTQAEYFKKALDGGFKETEEQEIDLPDEDPAVFSFVVAFLYEKRYAPIKPASEALMIEPIKGKGREQEEDSESSASDSGTESINSGSDNSARRRERAEAVRRNMERQWNERNRKVVGRHRLNCNCTSCLDESRLSCWNCGMSRHPPPPQNRPWHQPFGPFPGPGGPPPPPPPGAVINRHRGFPIPPPPGRNRRRDLRFAQMHDFTPEPRMTSEDMRTWLMAYDLTVDVYICADRYCMNEFKECIAKHITDYLETAGLDAAQPLVLECCKKLHAGLTNNDVLLKKVFARVGFLLSRLWKNFPEETQLFWMDNPEVGVLIMKETMERREIESGDNLPAMDRALQA